MISESTKVLQALGAFKSVKSIANNQTVLKFEQGRIFASYESIIVIEFFDDKDCKYSNQMFFGKDWNYSRTTSKYRNQFLSRDTKWCNEQVTSNEIKVLDI